MEENLYLLRPTTETRLIHRWQDEETKTAQVDYDKHAMTMDDDTKYVVKTSLLRNNSVISSITKTNIYDRVLHDQLSFFRHGFELLDFHDIDLGDSLPDDGTTGSAQGNGRELKKVILALLKSIGSNIVNFEKIPLPKRLPQRFSSHFKAVPFGQADSQFKSLKFKVVGQADGTPQGLRLKNYSAVKEKSCIFAAE